jgi:PleD family two-component response regulator
VTASIGVVEAANETIEALAQRADEALRDDKAARRTT